MLHRWSSLFHALSLSVSSGYLFVLFGSLVISSGVAGNIAGGLVPYEGVAVTGCRHP